ncbi:hypothetical protein LPA44_17210 [Halobacterium sp. KA-4]|uniref:DUF7096 domain-containing protein n=1 Tax=Halobacterium sp. KA-4 TaxID=2896367 RepID=UPI001E58E2CE|nr:hypothetical protein [Halobacterium sp. KA-4]MCD2201603.1 hypothetical protein [Halobacterium sp. KA-4]
MVYRRGIALLLCVLVVGSGATTVVATQSPPTNNQAEQAAVTTPAVISVNQDRGNFTDPEITITDALSIGQRSLEANLTQATIQTRLDTTETERQRTTVLQNATAALSQSVTQLRAESQQARQQYRQQELSTKAYSTRLAQIHSRAEDLTTAASFIEDQADDGTDVKSHAVELRAQLALFTGPVRERLVTAVTEGGGPERVYIGAGEAGTTTAVIEAGTYIREAMTPAQYNADPGPIPDAEPLLENIRQQYPWVMNQSAGVSFSPIPIQSSVPQYAYWLTLTYSGGTVNSYIDTSTQGVYQEVQRMQLNTLTGSPDATLTKAGRTLAISKSYAGGPLKVNMTTTDGEPIDAQIRLNNRSVGTTGADGVRWLLSPAGNYTVTAVSDGSEIEISDIEASAT